jgi:hypothetical protein
LSLSHRELRLDSQLLMNRLTFANGDVLSGNIFEDVSGFHDLLNVVDKELVILDIESWINGHLPAAAGDQG